MEVKQEQREEQEWEAEQRDSLVLERLHSMPEERVWDMAIEHFGIAPGLYTNHNVDTCF